MKKTEKRTTKVTMCAEYNFTGGLRGKYAQQHAAGSNVVVLDPDVAQMFPTARSVNSALRTLGEIASRRVRRTGGR